MVLAVVVSVGVYVGGDLPLNARIVTVADVYDALTHKRPYKTAWHIRKAVREMHRLSGSQFDADIIDAFNTLDPSKLAQALPADQDQHSRPSPPRRHRRGTEAQRNQTHATTSPHGLAPADRRTRTRPSFVAGGVQLDRP